jgi:hypothetical protein
MSDSHIAGKSVNNSRRKNIVNKAHLAMAIDPGAVGCSDTGALLAAMLESVQSQICHVSGFRMTENTENTTLFPEFVQRFDCHHILTYSQR